MSDDNIKRVGGLETFLYLRTLHWDQDARLSPCPFCGSPAGFHRKAGISEHDNMAYPVSAGCTNTSCGVMTPEMYATKETAIAAWNRRASATEGRT